MNAQNSKMPPSVSRFLAGLGAVVLVVVIVALILSHGSSGGGTSYPSWMCQRVTSDLSNAQAYINADDGSDLFDVADTADNTVSNFNNQQFSGSQLDSDLVALQGDATAMESGDPNNAQRDLSTVMHDCGKG